MGVLSIMEISPTPFEYGIFAIVSIKWCGIATEWIQREMPLNFQNSPFLSHHDDTYRFTNIVTQ